MNIGDNAIVTFVEEMTKDWLTVKCAVCGMEAKSATKADKWICSHDCATADLRAQLAARDEEIARLRALTDAYQADAMQLHHEERPVRARARIAEGRAAQLEARAKYFEDTVQHIVDACETYDECIETADAALADALPLEPVSPPYKLPGVGQ